MSEYISDISSLINAVINQLIYVGNHLNDYPLLIMVIAIWVIIASVSFLFALSNN